MDFREVGDARVTGRYQQFLPGSDAAPRMAGFFFGLKLPTGRTNVANDEGRSPNAACSREAARRT